MSMQPTLAPAPHQQSNGVSLGNDEVLRAQLLAATGNHQQHRAGPHGLPEIPNGSPSSSTHSQVIDPAIANVTNGSGMMSNSAGESGGDEGDGKKAQKRELSTSKRAAQNRQAQRAFRQRKEGHIKALEAQVRDYANLAENYKALQSENYRLRDYIIALQRRLIESQGEIPQPPADIDLSQQAPRHLAQAQALQQHAAQQQQAQAQAQAQAQQIQAANALAQQREQQQNAAQAPTAQMSGSSAGGEKGKNGTGKQKAGSVAAPYDHRAATLKDVSMGGWGSGVASASS